MSDQGKPEHFVQVGARENFAEAAREGGAHQIQFATEIAAPALFIFIHAGRVLKEGLPWNLPWRSCAPARLN
ncbi:MAG: hypothetical protein ACO3YN_05760 [Rubrivivax sp.]